MERIRISRGAALKSTPSRSVVCHMVTVIRRVYGYASVMPLTVTLQSRDARNRGIIEQAGKALERVITHAVDSLKSHSSDHYLVLLD
jgi:hypothetical protein